MPVMKSVPNALRCDTLLVHVVRYAFINSHQIFAGTVSIRMMQPCKIKHHINICCPKIQPCKH